MLYAGATWGVSARVSCEAKAGEGKGWRSWEALWGDVLYAKFIATVVALA